MTSAKIKKEAVTEAKIKNGAVNSTKIAAGSVGTSQLGSVAVTSEKLGDNAVTAGKIAAGAVGTGNLADGAVSTGKLAESERSQVFLAETATTSAELTHPLAEPPTVLVTLNLPTNGSYVVTGETEFIRSTGVVGYSKCFLADNGSQVAAMSDNYEAGVLFPTGGVSLTGIPTGAKSCWSANRVAPTRSRSNGN